MRETDFSTGEPYPHYYSGLVTSESESQELVRWEYMEREVQLLVPQISDTDFDTESLFFFGTVLPATKYLSSRWKLSGSDEWSFTFSMQDSKKTVERLAVESHIVRITSDEGPENVDVSLQF
ncbi:hypothetical protein [Haloarchaeobius sp. DFWS5]|uniref:hypothetical protein n=1 Tax=Haloarchaeobius sp. DFWS5 TaxID=3446114 RepID=UPI003EBCC057